MILLMITLTLAAAAYLLHLNYQYWAKRGVPGPRPVFLLGNVAPSFFLKKSLAEVYADIYKKYQHVPFVGIFRATSPALIVRDPEIIKEITVKSFSHFRDNGMTIDQKTDPLVGRNPFFLKGDEWKSTRGLLTPGFTGGKMKGIYPLLEEIAKQFVEYIQNHPKATNGEGCDAKELCLRFTLNNVGSCAFGLEAKCFEEENSHFQQLADRFFSADAFQMVKVFLTLLIPVSTKIISIRFTPDDVKEELVNLVTKTVKYREDSNIVRNDFLQVLHQLKKTSKNHEFTDIDVVAHAAGFFADGYETSSIVMSFLLYELARNPDAQATLRGEIRKAFEENEGKLPYEVLQGLPYLDGALYEALRLHPPLGVLTKLCTKPYTYIPKKNDVIKKPLHFEEGSTILIPLYGLHRDSKYFEDPDSFKPERFVGENRDKLTKYTLLPFGEGPRACLGQRFGILQIKVGLAYLIKSFELTVNKKTKVPIQYDVIYFLTFARGGLWIDFRKID